VVDADPGHDVVDVVDHPRERHFRLWHEFMPKP